MSRTAVKEILDRALLEEDFRADIEADPERALANYDLTDEERAVLVSRDLAAMDEFFPGALYCTIRFALINENIVAMQPFPDEARREELQRRGREITAMRGDRIGPLKEMLTLFR